MNKLYLHFKGDFVGALTEDKGDFYFEYDNSWKENGFEISPPLGFEKIEENAIKFFIENLLPEGEGLDQLSTYFQISKSNKFAILKEIGLETTGALTFSDTQTYTALTSFDEISYQDLEEKIRIRKNVPIHIWNGKPRLSVAGVQAKLPLTLLGDKMGFGEGDICSTHILKFNKEGENVVLNEYISMKLTKKLGLSVAEVECREIANECVLFVERFDRKIISEKEYI